MATPGKRNEFFLYLAAELCVKFSKLANVFLQDLSVTQLKQSTGKLCKLKPFFFYRKTVSSVS